MKVKHITIFLPDGNKNTYGIGERILKQKGSEFIPTNIKVKSIDVDLEKKESKILLSDKNTYIFIDMPFSFIV